jgi:hypothetical protein
MSKLLNISSNGQYSPSIHFEPKNATAVQGANSYGSCFARIYAEAVDVGSGTDRTFFWLKMSDSNGGLARVRFDASGGAPQLGFSSVSNGAINQVLTSRRTGWTAATGSSDRTTFATSTVTLATLAAHVKSLIDDLMFHGLIGT